MLTLERSSRDFFLPCQAVSSCPYDHLQMQMNVDVNVDSLDVVHRISCISNPNILWTLGANINQLQYNIVHEEKNAFELWKSKFSSTSKH